MAISVLLISYNVKGLLRSCLTSLGCDVEIVVADNASPDGSAEMVRQEFPHVRLVALAENRGFSAAVNAAAKVAAGDELLILNPDTVVTPEAVSRMPATLQHPGAWAAGFRQIDGKGRFQLSVGPPPSLLLDFGRRIVQRRLDAGDERVARLLTRFLSKPRAVPWVSGAALLVRRSAFEALGGFDEKFFLYFEDIDFCLRLRAAGGKVYYDPTVTIIHLGGESASTSRGVAARAYRQSQLYFWGKHRGPWARRLVRAYLKARGLAP
jgi:GT2 family glycosyltransferase